MRYLKIKSKGCIQVEAFTLLGASTKKGDSSKIGFFGSGAKYSLAALMKNNIPFKVFSGEDEIKFTTKDSNFRNQSFKVIQVNGVDTSLTTSMGGNDWDDSFSYIREIYSNALDEDEDAVLEVTEKTTGELGYTSYFIEYNSDVEKFYKNIFNYFCAKRPDVIFSNNHGSVYPNSDREERLFRKGILCHHNAKNKSAYTYNSPEFKINESRVLSDTWDAKYSIGQLWKRCNDPEVIKELLYTIQGGNTGLYEHTIIWGSHTRFSASWGEAVKELSFAGLEQVDLFDKDELEGRLQLPFEFLKQLRSQFSNMDILGVVSNQGEVYKEVENPSKMLQDKVIDAMGRLLNTDYNYRLESPKIKYVKFAKDTTLGMAEDNQILLSVKLDVYSVDEIAKIIIEENEHNKSGFDDKTREFQNHLFNLYYDELVKHV
ncbi:MAG: hypothetical protein CMH22_05850 [Methylophaga sp.]|nr:hypothetical protein [Methylophaga sp.]|tara:strand:+ start:79012 stop:80301 length:1290 start_codon:yes stop_codon:yes gene_type:complete